MAKDFGQAMDKGYMIPTGIAVGDGSPTDIRCQCDTVADFKTFATSSGFDIRYEGLVTYEKTNKKLMVYKGNDAWEAVGGGSDVNLEDYYTIEQVNNLIETHKHDSLYATKASEHTHSNKSILDGISNSKVSEWDAKATTNYVDTKIAEAQLGGGEVDLSGYATKDELQEYSGGKKHVYLTQAEYNALTEAEKNDETKVYGITDAEDRDATDLKLTGSKLELVNKDGVVIGDGVTLPSSGGSSVTVEDNLTSASTTNALSANQGKVLDNKITVLNTKIDNHLANHPSGEGGILKLVSPSGIEFLLKVMDDGSLYTEKVDVELPSDFPTITFKGTATYGGEFFITPHTEVCPYVIQVDTNCNIIWYKKVDNFAYNFRKYANSKGEVRYTYHDVIEEPTIAKAPGGHDTTELVVLDENKNEIDRIRMITNKSIKPLQPNECHDYMYIDDGHYYVSGYIRDTTSNWEGKGDNFTITNAVLQEIKDKQLLWHWESKEHFDLFADSWNDDKTSDSGADYCHFNSMYIDPNDSNLICSFRNTHTILKIDKSTGNILWKLGGKSDMFNVPSDKVWTGQHDCKILSSKDGIIHMTFYDNHMIGGNAYVVDITINENTKSIIELKTYKFKNFIGAYMGGVTKLSQYKDRYSINWGGGNSTVVSEVDFSKVIPEEIFSISLQPGDCDSYRVFRTITSVPSDDDEVAPGEVVIEEGNMIAGAWNGSCPPSNVNSTTEMKTENWAIPIQEGKTYRFELIGEGADAISSNTNPHCYNASKSKTVTSSYDGVPSKFTNGVFTFKLTRNANFAEGNEVGFFCCRAITGEIKENWKYKVTQLD